MPAWQQEQGPTVGGAAACGGAAGAAGGAVDWHIFNQPSIWPRTLKRSTISCPFFSSRQAQTSPPRAFVAQRVTVRVIPSSHFMGTLI